MKTIAAERKAGRSARIKSGEDDISWTLGKGSGKREC